MTAPKYGIVAMLDALGARNFNVKQAGDFFESQDVVLKKLEGFKESLKEVATKWGVQNSQTGVAMFADSIVLTWHLPQDTEYFLVYFGTWLRLIIMKGMQDGLLLRGSVSVGEFVQKGERVLGPAIVEANDWYEKKAQLIGVFAAPSCASLLSSLAESLTHKGNSGEDTLSLSFRQYPVPLKDKATSQMWALGWPIQFWIAAKNDGIEARRSFLETLDKYPIPEDKRANTIKFFDWYIKEFIELQTKMMIQLLKTPDKK